MKRLPARASPSPPLAGDERELLERLIIAERQIGDLRYREARMTEAVRWAALSSRRLELVDVAEMLETLIRPRDA